MIIAYKIDNINKGHFRRVKTYDEKNFNNIASNNLKFIFCKDMNLAANRTSSNSTANTYQTSTPSTYSTTSTTTTSSSSSGLDISNILNILLIVIGILLILLSIAILIRLKH